MKKLVVIAVLLTAIVTGAFAQAGAITDYMFGLPGGNYMETQWYVYSGFDKFYAQAGLSSSKADLGFATKTGGLYIGVSYGGDIFSQYDWAYTESEITFNGKDNTKTKQYGAPPANFNNKVDHDLGILIGVADMGFKLGFNSTYQILSVNEDATVGGVAYKSYKNELGDLTPSIRWGMAKNLTDKGIRPSVQLKFGFHVDQIEVERYYLAGATYKVLGTEISGRNNGTTDNYTTLGVFINLGGYTILSQDNGFEFSVDLDYELNADLYGENQRTYRYTAPGDTVPSVKTFKEKGRASGTDTFDTDVAKADHRIEPVLQAQWSSDKVGLGAKLHLPVKIGSDDSTSNSIMSGTGYTTAGTAGGAYKLYETGSVKKVSVEFSPELKLGGQYKLVPDKFNVNMGATIGLSTAKSETTETTVITWKRNDANTDWVKDKTTTSTTVTPSSSPTSSDFTIGATLFLTKNVILDAWTGVENATGFSLFGTGSGSVTYFGGILLMLSF